MDSALANVCIYRHQEKHRTFKEEIKMAKKYVCDVCGYEYDGEIPFDQLPDDYECPLCGVGKDQFSEVEE